MVTGPPVQNSSTTASISCSTPKVARLATSGRAPQVAVCASKKSWIFWWSTSPCSSVSRAVLRTPIRNTRFSTSAITVAVTSEEPMIGASEAGAAAAITGNASIDTPAISASPITSVRRASKAATSGPAGR